MHLKDLELNTKTFKRTFKCWNFVWLGKRFEIVIIIKNCQGNWKVFTSLRWHLQTWPFKSPKFFRSWLKFLRPPSRPLKEEFIPGVFLNFWIDYFRQNFCLSSSVFQFYMYQEWWKERITPNWKLSLGVIAQN